MNKHFVFIFIIISQIVNASELKYSRARIWLDGKPASALGASGIDLSEGDYKKDIWFTSDFSEKEIKDTLNKYSITGERIIKGACTPYSIKEMKLIKK